MIKRILVFPCGSEIGLEIHRSLQFSTHFELVGASSVDDHGRFVFDEYVGGLPFHNAPNFAEAIRTLVQDKQIDAIYPAMDAVADTLQHLSSKVGARVIGSTPETSALCASKRATYLALDGQIPLPQVFETLTDVPVYPVFLKPDRGYGARNTCLAQTEVEARVHLETFSHGEIMIVEYLPGREWTVDCFSDRHGKLLFHGPRIRSRISNGISVNTRTTAEYGAEFARWAEAINAKIRPRGAWFFQAKEDAEGKPKLLEVAARPGGSSGLFRAAGVNFALLSAFDAFDRDVTVTPNSYDIELDRALGNRFQLGLQFNTVYVDLDDCLIIRGKLNLALVSLLYRCVAEAKTIILLTRHASDPLKTLRRFRIRELFDSVVHITDLAEPKSRHIEGGPAIFIDDSFAERHDVATRCGIPVFSPDMVEALL